MSDIGIKQLAKNLGISTASVSRALSNPDRVSTAMRERVQTAAKLAGYRPNKMGASLRTSKTRNIIVIIPDISDTFNSGVIRSLERTAANRGYAVLFGDTQGIRELEITYGDMVQTRQADGIICFSHRLPFTDEDMASESFKMPPLVNSCEYIDANQAGGHIVPLVTIDNVKASRELTQHLIDLGHVDIAVITGDISSPSTTQRLQGYEEAMRSSGLPVQQQLIYEGTYTLEAGSTITKEILLAKKRPTAIFCMCDETALGCLYALKEHNFRIPQDISVVGFDDIKFAQYFSPALTTIAQPVAEIGKQCVEVLLDIIDGKEVKRPMVVLPHKLVIRDSTGPAPDH
jgi:LacI family repressor for deo operon, udp, cdd, tsx, nupC, and nupG